MTDAPPVSIDQNCHSLWDVIPKLHALARRGRRPGQLIEDIDAAFTAFGGGRMRLAREAHHPGGGADWGAALFYTEFLGRQPVDPADWEPLTGMTTAALARRLDLTVADLYRRFSPSDNWQLIGPSYVGDERHHRVIGDLTTAETAPYLRAILDTAERDMQRAFPAEPSRRRMKTWLARERDRVEGWLGERPKGRLADLYRAWLGAWLGDEADLGLTSERFDLDRAARDPVLAAFLKNYDRAAALYNEAIAETGVKLNPLDTEAGELPMLAVLDREGHLTRTRIGLEGGKLIVAGRSFALSGGAIPADALAAAGIRCLAGKALVLVLQVRCGQAGRPLALPYRGSLYMPTARRLEAELLSAGLLDAPLLPVLRIRFGLLDRLAELDTPLRLPAHLAETLGAEVMPARELSTAWRPAARRAAAALERLRTEEGRRSFQAEAFADLAGELDQLNHRRRELAGRPGKPDPEIIRPMSHRARRLETDLLERTLAAIDRLWQVAELDYYDSRGALLPWAVALGGEAFYNHLIERAEVYEERPRASHSGPADEDPLR
jgi:hypothetical protein